MKTFFDIETQFVTKIGVKWNWCMRNCMFQLTQWSVSVGQRGVWCVYHSGKWCQTFKHNTWVYQLYPSVDCRRHGTSVTLWIEVEIKKHINSICKSNRLTGMVSTVYLVFHSTICYFLIISRSVCYIQLRVKIDNFRFWNNNNKYIKKVISFPCKRGQMETNINILFWIGNSEVFGMMSAARLKEWSLILCRALQVLMNPLLTAAGVCVWMTLTAAHRWQQEVIENENVIICPTAVSPAVG